MYTLRLLLALLTFLPLIAAVPNHVLHDKALQRRAATRYVFAHFMVRIICFVHRLQTDHLRSE